MSRPWKGLLLAALAALSACPAAHATAGGVRGSVFVGFTVDQSQLEPGDLDSGVYRIEPSGAVTQIQPGDDIGFDVHPSGTHIAYRAGSGLGSVILRNLATGDERTLTSQGQRPLFSPDGEEIAVGISSDGGPRMRIFPTDGGDSRLLQILADPHHDGAAVGVRWTPDGILTQFNKFSQHDNFNPVSGRINPTTGAVSYLLADPTEPPPGDENDEFAQYMDSLIEQVIDVRPDAQELIAFDVRGKAWNCQSTTPSICIPPPACPGGTAQSSPGSCVEVGSIARINPNGTLALRPTAWLRIDLDAFPSLRWQGNFVASSYTPDAHTAGWKVTEFQPASGSHQFMRATFAVEDESATLLDPGVPIGITSSRVVWLADTFPVTIVNPPATTGASPQFSFQLEHAASGAFECSLDGADFAVCQTPLQLSDLADGPHTLRVRFHPEGFPVGEASELQWTVDRTAPSVEITSAPSGSTTETSASIAFASGDPSAVQFRCRLDDGPSEVCTSPYAVSGLEPGTHTVEVLALDEFSNASAPARATWQVVAAAAPPPEDAQETCPTGLLKKFVAGPIVAVAVRGCFTVVRDGAKERIEHAEKTKINGLEIKPLEDTKIIVERDASSGKVRWTGPVELSIGPFSYETTEPHTWGPVSTTDTALVNRLFSLADLERQTKGTILTVKVPTLELSTAKGGSAKITMGVSFPAMFTQIPGTKNAVKFNTQTNQWEGGGVGFELAPRISNDEGFALAGKVQVKELWLFGNVKLRDVTLGFDSGEKSLSASAILALNDVLDIPGIGLDKGAELAVSMSIGEEGILGTPLKELKVLAQKLERPLGHGFFLQRFGGGIGTRGATLMTLGTQVGVSWGPRFTFGAFTGELVSLDGTGTLLIPITPAGTGRGVEISGTVSALGMLTGNDGKLAITPPTASLTGHVDLPAIGVYRFTGELTRGDFDAGGERFTIAGQGALTLPIIGSLAGAQALVTERGWAVCTSLLGRRVGVGGARGVAAAAITPLVDACDLERVANGRATAAQAGATNVTVPSGKDLVALVARGSDAAPAITVAEPGGRTFEVRPDTGLKTDDAVGFSDPDRHETTLLVRDPRAGTWQVAGLDGSTVLSVNAALDAVAEVSGSVRAGRGATRVLRWKATLPGGARIDFSEAGTGLSSPVKTSTRGRGRTSFVPEPGLGRSRRLVAVVSRNGVPVREIVVARYRVNDRSTPARPRKLRLRGRVASWAAAAGAKKYVVSTEPPGRAAKTQVVRKRRVKLAAKTPVGTTVRVAGIDAAGHVGPAASVRVAKRPRR